MSRMDRFVTVVAAGMLLLGAALASVLLFAGTATAARAAEASAPAVGATPAASGLFDMLDRNKDQVLSRQEFQSGYAGLQRFVAMQARLHAQFGVLDLDRSGAIDGSEYANLELIRRMGKTAPPLSAFDADRDRKLGFAEYTTLVRKLAAPPSSTTK